MQSTLMFPAVKGANLAGRSYNLPGDLAGEYNVVVLAFQRWHQDLVDTWMPGLAMLAAQQTNLHYYELPVLQDYGFIGRMMIDGGMRAGIPDQEVRTRTITLYLDLPRFLVTLGIADTHDIHVLLLDQAGKVLWRASGACDPEKLAGLATAARG